MTTTKKVLGMILIGIIYFVFDTLLQAGYFKTIENTTGQTALKVYTQMTGTEDLEWDRPQNKLYISATDRRSYNLGEPNSQDGVYLLPTDKKGATPVKMRTDFEGDFHPHGMSLFYSDSLPYLYVVNHTFERSSVELFKIENEFLSHLQTFTGVLLSSPNDVVGDEIGKFYVTNDHGNTSAYGRAVEDYLRMPYSFVLYYDGVEFKKAHEGMVYANGVQLSNDGTQLYASHTTGHEIFILDRKKNTGALTLKKTIDLGTGLDNIDVDENNVIWVAAHAKIFDFLGHSKDSAVKSPSQFFRINEQNGKFNVTKVYENDGNQISGSSVVVVKNDTAFVGCVFDPMLLELKLD
tara:strand:+ start:55636 stop:56685 length:1050 start_codon:yes stop_codon:yes gene_type:complete